MGIEFNMGRSNDRPDHESAGLGFAKPVLEAAHGKGPGTGGVTVAGEMEEPVEDVGQQLIALAEAVAFAKSGGDIGTDHHFPLGKGEDISRGRIAQMAVMQKSAFPGGNENDAHLSGESAEPRRWQAAEGGVQLPAKIGEIRWMPSLTVDPADVRLFWIHGGPWGNGCGGEADSPRLRRGPCGRLPIGTG